jgi:hypothetical protein
MTIDIPGSLALTWIFGLSTYLGFPFEIAAAFCVLTALIAL